MDGLASEESQTVQVVRLKLFDQQSVSGRGVDTPAVLCTQPHSNLFHVCETQHRFKQQQVSSRLLSRLASIAFLSGGDEAVHQAIAEHGLVPLAPKRRFAGCNKRCCEGAAIFSVNILDSAQAGGLEAGVPFPLIGFNHGTGDHTAGSSSVNISHIHGP